MAVNKKVKKRNVQVLDVISCCKISARTRAIKSPETRRNKRWAQVTDVVLALCCKLLAAFIKLLAKLITFPHQAR